MIETMCTYPDRDEWLVAYLYDDIEPAEWTAFDAHVAACGRCRRELAELRGVRSTLSAWAPPEPARATPSGEPRAPNHEPRATSLWWHDIPAWAQVAAALLVLGVSAGIANLDVHYDHGGLTVRTGWSKTSPQPVPVTTQPAARDVQNISAPWRADLAALERQLRTEFHAVAPTSRAASATSAMSSMSDAELRRRVGSILEASERRQERELALRVAELLKDVNAQRQADLVKIDRSLGYIQSNTYGEAMKQRELINYLVKVSQKQ
jgi:hypothetical protein